MVVEPATTVDADALRAAFVAAFADYLAGPVAIEPAQWPGMLARHGVDLGESRVVRVDGAIAAFALVAPRPALGRWRLAAMGALPVARGTGAAPALLDDVIARATAAGLDAVELECFARNERALALYRGRGFETVADLHGWTLADPRAWPGEPSTAAAIAAVVTPTPRVVDLDMATAWLQEAEQELGDLPLQVGVVGLRAPVRPLTAWQRGSAQLVFAAGGGLATRIVSLVDLDDRQHDARSLVAALRLRHPDAPIELPPLQRDDVGGEALALEGFERWTLHQRLMVRASTALRGAG